MINFYFLIIDILIAFEDPVKMENSLYWFNITSEI